MGKNARILGATPVGHIAELGALEAAAVRFLRRWCDTPCAQQEVWNELAGRLGPKAGREALKALEALCALCMRHGRRTFMRHRPNCTCLAADEACFANLVAHATEGEREDALLIATLLVRPDVSPQLAALAQTFGLALKRMARTADCRVATSSRDRLH